VKQRLLDLLACPHCKHFPLTLKIIEQESIEVRRQIQEVLCTLYCGRFGGYVKDLTLSPADCHTCMGIDVKVGVLGCGNCGRWFPIIDAIPHMLPDELRNEREDREFLETYKAHIPAHILMEGKPFNLSGR
jgi:uncharacterized protein YbaR (Trm112 family)